MERNILGATGMEVSPLCFGALPLGPLQKNLPLPEGAALIRKGLEQGINFIDTAESYFTYPYIKEALTGFTGEVIISSKSMATTYEDMEKAVFDGLSALERSYFDIFHLHAARTKRTVFEERGGAFQCLKDLKKKGVIRAIGIATHAIEVVEGAAEEKDIDVVFPLINQAGLGIVGGTKEEMIRAITQAHQKGKGLFAMKALAGGNLIDQVKESYDFVLGIPGISSVAVGMVEERELEINVKLFNHEEVILDPIDQVKAKKRLWIFKDGCIGCGACVDACPNNALMLKDDKAEVDTERCILCGYCSPHCPQFAIRLF
ncbi:aldo/keto reductase [Dehalobacterium formicoaceticum]|uniref:Aldo/keto reductase n=1 Tax=Dehalobacterium formicoaceticum TaxID=51515 RepID=A0ABT1Y6Y3_9FIRM|nr:aldo/keto reductase [Dehalobacterium formicoaceticum]MCR6546650.1 aldo/keto reductase [Dehalobacterium formicoaceticum]